MEALKTASSEELVNAYDVLAGMHQERGALSTAIGVVDEAFQTAEQMGMDTTALKDRKGGILTNLGMYVEALRIREELLAYYVNKLGTDDPQTLRCRAECSELYGYLGNVTKAGEYAAVVMEVTNVVHPSSAVLVRRACECVASFMILTSQYKKASSVRGRVLAMLKDTIGERHKDSSRFCETWRCPVKNWRLQGGREDYSRSYLSP